MSEPALATASEPSSSPFKFLDFFKEADHDLFAGRDREVNEVLAGILRARTLILYGRSGLGKTSLLLAGVFPEIRKRGLTPVYMRPFERPLDDLRTALEESFPDLAILGVGNRPEASLATAPGEHRSKGRRWYVAWAVLWLVPSPVSFHQ